MPRKFESHSLQVLYRDFLLPGQKDHCCSCNRHLATGVAVFLLVDGAPAPFGPTCASNISKSGTSRIPDHTKGLSFLKPDESDTGVSVDSIKDAAHASTSRQRFTPEQQDVANAILYASLRISRLPALGFPRLDYEPVRLFLEAYDTGKLDRARLKAVLTTISKNDTNPRMQHLSLDNLRACYGYAWLLHRVHAAPREPDKRMNSVDYEQWGSLGRVLRKDMFLPPESCEQVHALAKRYLPSPPNKVDVRFVAAKPPFVPKFSSAPEARA